MSDTGPKPDTEHIAAETFAERARLVDLMADLPPEQWGRPSLCEEWQVRHVVAHLTFAYRTGPLSYLGAMARAGFNFDRMANRAVRADVARLSDAELVACLRDNVDNPWQPPGGGAVGALSHDVIHGLDITEALGLPPAPPARIGLVLQHAGRRNLAYFGVDLGGHRLEATDADVTVGTGTVVRLPVRELLLVVTGRRPLPAVA
ncbi:maleylpyruvate isomerase family mycothiol-dependent enzyme [Propionibacteriaceae bacterium Y2011]|uniref:maleylpyruvate isomerase family mycothiol-dependent enzyme n=1 Tax=Microlunatus sp. Y2014 TaxID=3418488 RepID=UPI003B4BD3F1